MGRKKTKAPDIKNLVHDCVSDLFSRLTKGESICKCNGKHKAKVESYDDLIDIFSAELYADSDMQTINDIISKMSKYCSDQLKQKCRENGLEAVELNDLTFFKNVKAILLGEWIKQNRTELKLSIQELSQMIGSTVSTLYRYQSGEILDMPWDGYIQLTSLFEKNPKEIARNRSRRIEYVYTLDKLHDPNDTDTKNAKTLAALTLAAGNKYDLTLNLEDFKGLTTEEREKKLQHKIQEFLDKMERRERTDAAIALFVKLADDMSEYAAKVGIEPNNTSIKESLEDFKDRLSTICDQLPEDKEAD